MLRYFNRIFLRTAPNWAHTIEYHKVVQLGSAYAHALIIVHQRLEEKAWLHASASGLTSYHYSIDTHPYRQHAPSLFIPCGIHLTE
jgi:hypothetical protein